MSEKRSLKTSTPIHRKKPIITIQKDCEQLQYLGQIQVSILQDKEDLDVGFFLFFFFLCEIL